MIVTHNNRGKRRANPLPATIRRAREVAGLTQKQAGELLHTTPAVWMSWETSEGVNARRMHPAFWELFLIKSGLRNHPEFDPDLD